MSGGSDAATLVWYDACMLGADHSCPVTRSQWKEDNYLHSLIPVSKGGGTWVCNGSGGFAEETPFKLLVGGVE